jgi:hypothetical protein
MRSSRSVLLRAAAALAALNTACAAGTPLKIYIMAGQSNMQGKARVFTIERLNVTENSRPLYIDTMGDDGKHVGDCARALPRAQLTC